MVCGALIWVNYSFPQYEYYHPQRTMGTLIRHYRYHTIHDPFFFPGQVDLTSHVNFSTMVDSGEKGGLDLVGFTNQATFLINNDIADLLLRLGDSYEPCYIRQASAV